jgi:hypothetical protein
MLFSDNGHGIIMYDRNYFFRVQDYKDDASNFISDGSKRKPQGTNATANKDFVSTLKCSGDKPTRFRTISDLGNISEYRKGEEGKGSGDESIRTPDSATKEDGMPHGCVSLNSLLRELLRQHGQESNHAHGTA